MQQVRAKKALGQHFLTDMAVAGRIAATLDEAVGKMPVLEVGPGMGVLTRFLLYAGHDLRVVELDDESVDYLRRYFPQLAADGRIVAADFLQLDLHQVFGDQPFCIIGNYPYNISSQIFFKLLEYRDQVPLCSGMLQREVAQRIAAPPGSRTYGILSVLLQAWYDIEYLFTVDEGVFDPPPKVKSGVIRLRRNAVASLGCEWALFKTVVKVAFGQRRKTLRNSLRSMLPTVPAQCEALMAMRPEQLGVEQFVALTNAVAQARAATVP